MAYETFAVPFTPFGNRRGFTEMQMCEDPVCREFYERWPQCFETDILLRIVIFIEADA